MHNGNGSGSQGSQGLPFHSGPVNHMVHGLTSLEHAHKAKHPVYLLQSERQNKEWTNKLDMVRRTYGSHLAMELEAERQTFSSKNRLPGLASSNISLQIVLGQDNKIDVEDYLNDEFLRPQAHKIELHTAMEVKLGLH